MATDVNAELYTEIENSIERIHVLAGDGNADGAKELEAEVETMLGALKGKGITAKRVEYRESIRVALATKPSAELVVKAPATIEEVEGLDALVNLGAQSVRDATESKVLGAKKIAEIQLDIRRRIFVDGVPDLQARSNVAKLAAAEVYDRVLGQLPAEGESELADGVRAEIGSIKRAAQDAMVDLRALYLRSLDNEENTEERALFAAALDPHSDAPMSEQVADYCGIKQRNTRAEMEKARRDARAELASKAAAGGELDPEESAELAGEKYVTPYDAVRKLPAAIAKLTAPVGDLDADDVAEVKEKLTDKARLKLIADLKAQVNAMNALILELA